MMREKGHKMKVIVGLGNPGMKYRHTKHNVGFDTIDILAKRHDIKIKKKEFFAYTGTGYIGSEKVLLLKPQTYMNESGISVDAALDFYKVGIEDLIVISDDLTLDIGVLRLRSKGSDGGHNGLKNIITWLESSDFTRLRIGIGKVPEGSEVIRHVLSKFDKKDRENAKKTFEVAAEAIEFLLEEGLEKAMSKYNGSVL